MLLPTPQVSIQPVALGLHSRPLVVVLQAVDGAAVLRDVFALFHAGISHHRQDRRVSLADTYIACNVVRTPDADYVPVLTLYLLCSFHTVPRYQLIQFILQVKGTQFLSGGLINSFVMAASYWRCVNWAGGLASGAAHDCDTSGSYLCHTISMLYAHLISFSFVPPHLRSQRYGSLCRSMTNISVPISCCWYCFPSFRPRESVLLLLGNGWVCPADVASLVGIHTPASFTAHGQHSYSVSQACLDHICQPLFRGCCRLCVLSTHSFNCCCSVLRQTVHQQAWQVLQTQTVSDHWQTAS